MSAPSARPAPVAPSTTPALTTRSRHLALGVIATGMLMIILDGSIVTVAMPPSRTTCGSPRPD